MSTIEKDLKIKVSIDKKTGAIKSIGSDIEAIGRKTKSARDQLEKFSFSLQYLGNRAFNFFSIRTELQALTNTIGSVIQPMIDTTANFEKLSLTLKTIEGSSQKANQSLNWVEQFATQTPFQLDQVANSFVKLKAYGIEPTDGTLKTLGNIASAMGKSIDQAVEALADAVQGENERLKEFGIKASKSGEQITYTYATAAGEIKKISVKNSQDIIKATLSSIWNEKYSGAMQEQMQSFNGISSNLSDNIDKTRRKLMVQSGAFDALKVSTQGLGVSPLI